MGQAIVPCEIAHYHVGFGRKKQRLLQVAMHALAGCTCLSGAMLGRFSKTSKLSSVAEQRGRLRHTKLEWHKTA